MNVVNVTKFTHKVVNFVTCAFYHNKKNSECEEPVAQCLVGREWGGSRVTSKFLMIATVKPFSKTENSKGRY